MKGSRLLFRLLTWAALAAAPALCADAGYSGFDAAAMAGRHPLLNLALASGVARVPLAFEFGGTEQQNSVAPASNAGTGAVSSASGGSWIGRHRTLLAGLAMMGAGAALVATGGDGHSNGGCFSTLSTGTLCTAPGPVWLGAQRLTGVLIGGLGVPVTILGLLKH